MVCAKLMQSITLIASWSESIMSCGMNISEGSRDGSYTAAVKSMLTVMALLQQKP